MNGIMAPNLLAGVTVFAIAMAFTPGPNNLMLASSGANYGLRRTLPHLLGVAFGFPAMLTLVGCGIASVFVAFPVLQSVLKVAGAIYLLWLAWRTATSGSSLKKSDRHPLSFWQAAAFQWVNAKAWVIAVGAVTTYTTGSGRALVAQVLIIGLIDVFVSLASCLTWTLFGQLIGAYLTNDRRRKIFNFTMAGLLVASIVPVAFEA